MSFLSSLGDMIQSASDPYEVLGVTKSSTKQQIRSAYKSLASQFHPDKSLLDPDLSNQVFCKISSAYDRLSSSDSAEDSAFIRFEKAERAKEGKWGHYLDMMISTNTSKLRTLFCAILIKFTLILIVTMVVRSLFLSSKNERGFFRFEMHPKFNLRANTPCNDYVVFLERDFYQRYDINTQKKIMRDVEIARLQYYEEKCKQHNLKIDLLKQRLEIAGYHERSVIRDEIRSLNNIKICLEYDIGQQKLKSCKRLD